MHFGIAANAITIAGIYLEQDIVGYHLGALTTSNRANAKAIHHSHRSSQNFKGMNRPLHRCGWTAPLTRHETLELYHVLQFVLLLLHMESL